MKCLRLVHLGAAQRSSFADAERADDVELRPVRTLAAPANGR